MSREQGVRREHECRARGVVEGIWEGEGIVSSIYFVYVNVYL